MTRHYIIHSLLFKIILVLLVIGPIVVMVYYICQSEWWSVIMFGLLQFFCWFVLLVGGIGRYGFMDKTPSFMFIINMLNEVNYFRKRGYAITNILGAGSVHPSVLMEKPGMPKVEIYYNCPPLMWNYSSLKIDFGDRIICRRYDINPDMNKFACKYDSIFGPADPEVVDLEEYDLERLTLELELKKRKQRKANQSYIITND